MSTEGGGRRQNTGGRVLVVIPDPLLRAELDRILAPRYAVETVADARAAMELALASPPQAIVSELRLPEIDALSFLRRLRNDPRTAMVPVILTSRSVVESAISVALASGASDFVAQPVNPGELFARLAAHIERAAQRQLQTGKRALLAPVGQRESLEQNLMVLDTLLMNAPVGFCFLDLEGRYLRANQALAAIDGFSVESHIGKRFPEILIPAISRDVAASFNHVVKHGTAVANVSREYAGWLSDADGMRHLVSSYYPVRLRGEIFGVGMLVHDRTEQRRAERDLDASRARVGEILESMPEGFLLLDGAGRCRYVNQAAQRILASDAQGELLGTLVNEAFPLDPPIERLLESARGTGTSVHASCYSKASRRWFEPFVYPSEDLASFSIFLRDVTDKHAAQREHQALGAKEKAAREDAKTARIFGESAILAKDQFLAAISHELRAPLAAIGMWAQVLLAGKVDDRTVIRGLEAIRSSATAQSLLIEDLIDHTRTASQTFKLDTRPLDLVPLLEEAVESIRPTAAAKKIVLSCSVPATRFLVAGDAARLHQVLVNLLSNACKFTPTKGRITVTLGPKTAAVRSPPDERVEIVIRDNGKGIDAGFLAHVFEPFRQADVSTARVHGGLGLGLSIASQITLLHGGTIEAESAGEGKGSRFTVTLPLLAGQTRPVAASKTRRASAADEQILRNVKVLVVDDDARQREALSALLQRYGAEVTIATSSRDALRKLGKQRVDVLLSDLAMPHEDGFALIRKVRALKGNVNRVPAATLTGRMEPHEATEALLAGFQAHLSKTLDPAELVAAVRALATRRPGAP